MKNSKIAKFLFVLIALSSFCCSPNEKQQSSLKKDKTGKQLKQINKKSNKEPTNLNGYLARELELNNDELKSLSSLRKKYADQIKALKVSNEWNESVKKATYSARKKEIKRLLGTKKFKEYLKASKKYSELKKPQK